MDFALSADSALQCMSDVAAASLILILSDINMRGMTGLELLPKAKAARPDVPVIMISGLTASRAASSIRREAINFQRLLRLPGHQSGFPLRACFDLQRYPTPANCYIKQYC